MAQNRLDEGGLNASGAARRRLIRAVGMGSLGAMVSLDWSRPAIRLGALPAHAAASVSCAVGIYALQIDASGGGIGVSILVSTDTAVDSSYASSFATTFTASGSETALVVNASVTVSSPAGITLGRTCCSFQSEAVGGLTAGSHDLGQVVFLFDEVGECSLQAT